MIRPEQFDQVFREHYGDRGVTVTMRRTVDDGLMLRAAHAGTRLRAEASVDPRLLERLMRNELDREAGEAIFKLADDLVKWVTQPEPEPRPGIGRGEG